MSLIIRIIWPGIRLLILPFVWAAWIPAVVMVLAGIGCLQLVFVDPGGVWGKTLDTLLAVGLCSIAAAIFELRRRIIRPHHRYTRSVP